MGRDLKDPLIPIPHHQNPTRPGSHFWILEGFLFCLKQLLLTPRFGSLCSALVLDSSVFPGWFQTLCAPRFWHHGEFSGIFLCLIHHLSCSSGVLGRVWGFGAGRAGESSFPGSKLPFPGRAVGRSPSPKARAQLGPPGTSLGCGTENTEWGRGCEGLRGARDLFVAAMRELQVQPCKSSIPA